MAIPNPLNAKQAGIKRKAKTIPKPEPEPEPRSKSNPKQS